MPPPSSTTAEQSLHSVFNALNATLANLQLQERRLQRRDRSDVENQLLSGLEMAGRRLRDVVGELRNVEAILGAMRRQEAGPHPSDHRQAAGSTPVDERDAYTQEDEDLFFDSEEGADY